MKNAKALIKVAEWLEDGAKHVSFGTGHEVGVFDMEQAVTASGFGSDYREDACGTACCIAGAIVQFENLISPVLSGAHDFFDSYDGAGVGTIAAKHLGISEEDAEQLFEPWNEFGFEGYSEFSDPQRAAKVVRHYLETGIVDWDLFEPAPEFCDQDDQ